MVEIITILVIIATLIIFFYLNVPTILARARDAKRKIDIKKMAIAISEYYEDANCYPQAIPNCNYSFKENGLTLMSDIPCDPKTDLSYVYIPETKECPSWFRLYTNLEYEEDKIIDKVNCRNGCGPKCQFNYGTSSSNQDLNPYCKAEEGDGDSPPDQEDDPLQYACTPGGACEVYEAPELSGCPDVYIDDPTCQEKCGEKENRCHDAKGKKVPDS